MQRQICIATAMHSSQMSSCVDQPAYIVCISDVDPYIGFGDIGHVFNGTNTPFVAAQLGLTDSSQSFSGHSVYYRPDIKVCHTQVATLPTYATPHSLSTPTITRFTRHNRKDMASDNARAWFEAGIVGISSVRRPFDNVMCKY